MILYCLREQIQHNLIYMNVNLRKHEDVYFSKEQEETILSLETGIAKQLMGNETDQDKEEK